MESILTSIKKLIGIDEQYEQFDTDIIICINTAISILTQLGVGPVNGFSITDSSATWKDFLGDDPRLSMVKTYVHMKVRLLFDPPMSSAVTEVIKSQISELEWRINVQVDPEEVK